MIHITSDLTFSNYLLSNWIKISNSWAKYLVSLIIFFILIEIILRVTGRPLFIQIIVLAFILVGVPIIKYLLRLKYGFSKISYFFDTDTFGYQMNSYTVSMAVKEIVSIKTGTLFILIKTRVVSFYIVSSKENIEKVIKMFQKSDYSKFMQQ